MGTEYWIPNLSRNSVVRSTDRPDMIIVVYRGRKAKPQHVDVDALLFQPGVPIWIFIHTCFRVIPTARAYQRIATRQFPWLHQDGVAQVVASCISFYL